MATTSKASTAWSVDKTHSEIGFKVKHMMISNIYGSFGDYTIHASTNHLDFSTAEIEFTAKTASIRTGQTERDAHLKSDDFFNAAQFPEIVFKSTSFVKIDAHSYELNGLLTIRDITHPVTLDVEYTGTAGNASGELKAGFSVRGKIRRNDYHLKWNVVTEAGSVVVSDEVKILCEVQMIRQQ